MSAALDLAFERRVRPLLSTVGEFIVPLNRMLLQELVLMSGTSVSDKSLLRGLGRNVCVGARFGVRLARLSGCVTWPIVEQFLAGTRQLSLAHVFSTKLFLADQQRKNPTLARLVEANWVSLGPTTIIQEHNNQGECVRSTPFLSWEGRVGGSGNMSHKLMKMVLEGHVPPGTIFLTRFGE
ncbi:MAG: hypothetical protein KBC26_00205 [Candidatus Pacebacteria bacterium]|nr:hypothetical protein [Candidatus Paceibacterota bacterium]